MNNQWTNRPLQRDRGDVLNKSLKRSGGLVEVKTIDNIRNIGERSK